MKTKWLFAILLGGLVLAVGFCFLASNIYYNRGMEHWKHQGNPEKEFRMAIRLNPFNAEAHYHLSHCLPRISPKPKAPSKDYREIEKELRWTIRLKPSHAMAHYELGGVLSDQGKEEDAVKEYRLALRLIPNDYLVHWELGKLLWKLGKLDEAEREYREAIRLKPKDSEYPENRLPSQYKLVELLMDEGKYPEAEQEAKLIPYPLIKHSYLGQIYYKLGKLSEAENEYREVIQSADDEWAYGAYDALGDILAREGKYNAAEKMIRQRLRLFPQDNYLYYYLGCCYASWGKKEKAIVSLQEAADKGFSGWATMEKDTLLNGLHGDPRFNKIAEKVKENREKFDKSHYPL